jgi:hypothetical protein
MLGSAVIGGFILAMIEGTGILINRYSQILMPQPGLEGKEISLLKNLLRLSFCLESPPDLNKGKVDLSIPTFFTSSSGQSSTPNNFS